MNYNYNFNVNENYTTPDGETIAMFSGGSSTVGAATFTMNVLDWELYLLNKTDIDQDFEIFKAEVISKIGKLREES